MCAVDTSRLHGRLCVPTDREQTFGESAVAAVSEAAWQLHQRFAHADYLGDEPDLWQLRRDLVELSLLVHTLAESVK